jgi:hypothetical protein
VNIKRTILTLTAVRELQSPFKAGNEVSIGEGLLVGLDPGSG